MAAVAGVDGGRREESAGTMSDQPWPALTASARHWPVLAELPPTWVGDAPRPALLRMDMDQWGIIRRLDVLSPTIAQAGVMTAITTSRPTNQELAPTGESPGRHWFKTVLTALLAGVLCLVLIGVTRTASALITGKN